MKIIYITLEIKDRELLSKLFFISKNLNEKYIFFIGDKRAVLRAINTFGKGIYFYKSINKNDLEHISRIKKKGNIFVSLDEEGGYGLDKQFFSTHFLQLRSSQDNMNLIDRIFTWGNFDHKEWKKKYKNSSKKIKKTGSPKLDLWRKEVFMKIFKNEIDDLNRKYSPFFLIPSTFYSSRENYKLAVNIDKKLSKDDTLISLKKRLTAKKYERYLFFKFVNLIKKLSYDFPNHKIIVKPHTLENIDDWRKIFKRDEYKNIIIDNNYNLTAYIAASECVIFNSSTSGMQSVAMGKKTLAYGNNKNSSFRNFSNLCATQVSNYKELKKRIRDKTNIENKKNIRKIKSRLHFGKQTNSELIMKNIKIISNKNLENVNLKSFKLNFIIFGYFLIDNLSLILKFFKELIYGKKASYYQGYSIKMRGGIFKNEIIDFFKKLNLHKKVKIRSFGRNGFIISKYH